MATAQPPALPDGRYVEWQGRTYRGSVVARPPDSVRIFTDSPADDTFSPTRGGGWSRTVPRDEVRMVRLRTYCRWRGEPFAVQGRTADGRLQLAYLGRNSHRAEELGLTMVDKGVWAGVAAESEVTDLRQERAELGATPED